MSKLDLHIYRIGKVGGAPTAAGVAGSLAKLYSERPNFPHHPQRAFCVTRVPIFSVSLRSQKSHFQTWPSSKRASAGLLIRIRCLVTPSLCFTACQLTLMPTPGNRAWAGKKAGILPSEYASTKWRSWQIFRGRMRVSLGARRS